MKAKTLLLFLIFFTSFLTTKSSCFDSYCAATLGFSDYQSTTLATLLANRNFIVLRIADIRKPTPSESIGSSILKFPKNISSPFSYIEISCSSMLSYIDHGPALKSALASLFLATTTLLNQEESNSNIEKVWNKKFSTQDATILASLIYPPSLEKSHSHLFSQHFKLFSPFSKTTPNLQRIPFAPLLLLFCFASAQNKEENPSKSCFLIYPDLLDSCNKIAHEHLMQKIFNQIEKIERQIESPLPPEILLNPPLFSYLNRLPPEIRQKNLSNFYGPGIFLQNMQAELAILKELMDQCSEKYTPKQYEADRVNPRHPLKFSEIFGPIIMGNGSNRFPYRFNGRERIIPSDNVSCPSIDFLKRQLMLLLNSIDLEIKKTFSPYTKNTFQKKIKELLTSFKKTIRWHKKFFWSDPYFLYETKISPEDDVGMKKIKALLEHYLSLEECKTHKANIMGHNKDAEEPLLNVLQRIELTEEARKLLPPFCQSFLKETGAWHNWNQKLLQLPYLFLYSKNFYFSLISATDRLSLFPFPITHIIINSDDQKNKKKEFLDSQTQGKFYIVQPL